ncbi:hypothetical protein JCM10908_002126 [Rhodotorula pacifica]|uniref:uncharacterized protein n=1 Tax=Rhodotorula pacifica TaxID=1495444 RepID=UPI00316FB78C
MSGLRQARKTTQLATQLQQILAGPSARPLPAVVEGLTIRSEGIKGNAGARHFVKTAIPGLRFANPSLRISFEQVPIQRRRKHAPTSEAQEAATASEAASGAEANDAAALWKQPPGLTVTFTDANLPPAFFPLPPQKSDRLVSAFWQTFGNEDSVRAWASGKSSSGAGLNADAAAGAAGDATVKVVDEVPVKGDGEALVGGERQHAP